MSTVIDPRLRVRSHAKRTPTASKAGLSDTELLEEWFMYEQGKVADFTRGKYRNFVRDVLAWVRDEEGKEVPLSRWTPEQVWDYALHVEENYCRSYLTVNTKRGPFATCLKGVWQSALEPTAALAHCSSCDRFERPPVYNRLYALSRFFDWLVRCRLTPANFVRDIAKAVRKEAPDPGDHEKKRNPSLHEMRVLVNGTIHLRNRAFYASSACWFCRPNEMLLLDRYASFGQSSPTGEEPPGFEEGFRLHPHLKAFDQGGDLVYIPKVKGARDKRKGNRWLVIHPELRPILGAYLGWWDERVKRHPDGRPVTTLLWITERGTPTNSSSVTPPVMRLRT